FPLKFENIIAEAHYQEKNQLKKGFELALHKEYNHQFATLEKKISDYAVKKNQSKHRRYIRELQYNIRNTLDSLDKYIPYKQEITSEWKVFIKKIQNQFEKRVNDMINNVQQSTTIEKYEKKVLLKNPSQQVANVAATNDKNSSQYDSQIKRSSSGIIINPDSSFLSATTIMIFVNFLITLIKLRQE
ncbi:hypothetical protein HK099_007528, partial [Clydaea vesicula]